MKSSVQEIDLQVHNKIPISAMWLGGLGALPFIVLSSLSVFMEPLLVKQTNFALVVYGAVILSFLGGIHWGLAIATPELSPHNIKIFLRLLISIFPCLIGWLALLLTIPTGLLIVAIAFFAMLLYDWYASHKGLTPKWYLKLRVPLTLIAGTSLTLVAITLFFQS